jgi:hypothetical protein
MLRRSLVLFAFSVAACSGAIASSPVPSAQNAQSTTVPAKVIDGFTIGARLDTTTCASTDVACAAAADADAKIVRDALLATRPGLDPSTITALHWYSQILPPGYEQSGSFTVAVFDLADGSQAAMGLACGVTDCKAITASKREPSNDHGPLVDPSP